ncbi:MAG: MFS transporter [Gemmatimonadaceae bacterium]
MYFRMVKLPRTVLALALVSLLTDVSSEMIYPLLPVFLRDVLGAGAFAVGAIEGAAESVASLLKLVSGWWSDRLSRRKPLVLAGYTLASAARPLLGLATSVWQVTALRLTDRTGKGIRTAPRDALIADAVPAEDRGRAFGFHRASDHLGAVIGPLVAVALLRGLGASMRTVFLVAAIPAALAVVALMVGVVERPRALERGAHGAKLVGSLPHGVLRPYLALVLLFTLGNATDAFLLLRATDVGVPVATLPLLWALLHVVKSTSSVPSGVWSDRIGRRPLIVGGWLWYGVVYALLGRATVAWQMWALVAVYGLYFGLTEGVEKALVADLSLADDRGSAFGWYHLVVGLGALPASMIFGAIWQWRGPAAAFDLGAVLALLAAVGLAMLRLPAPPSAGLPQSR